MACLALDWKFESAGMERGRLYYDIRMQRKTIEGAKKVADSLIAALSMPYVYKGDRKSVV